MPRRGQARDNTKSKQSGQDAVKAKTRDNGGTKSGATTKTTRGKLGITKEAAYI